jgi:pilus assembly protein CpaF
MNAFGKRNGLGQRPSFGVARPMKGGSGQAGGDQFPPVEDLPEEETAAGGDAPASVGPRAARWIASTIGRTPAAPLHRRRARVSKLRSHRIKEQVLPRLLERVDPEAAATLGKDELAEEFRPIIGEVLAELKITLNRREQFALEKVLVDELLGLGPA